MKATTSTGRVITDGEIQSMADEAEAKYDQAKLRRRPGRPSLGSAAADVFPVRLDPEFRAALEASASDDDTTASDIVRNSLRAYLHVVNHHEVPRNSTIAQRIPWSNRSERDRQGSDRRLWPQAGLPAS